MGNENWTSEKIPDLLGKVVIITGSSSGLGYEAARVIANKNAEVIIAVRNLDKGEKAAEKIKAQNVNANVSIMKIDLADLDSIRAFADEFKSKYSKLDLLINNAGVMIPPYSQTKQGFELQMGTNHLGHFLLTGLLFDLITKTEGSRIVNVSSGAHKAGQLNFDDLSWQNRKYAKWRSYGDSKIANLYFTFALADKLVANESKTIVTASHPGWTATELQRHMSLARLLNSIFAMPIEQGALTTLRAAFDTDAKNGDYFGPNGFLELKGYPVKVDSNNLSKNKVIREKLWNVSEELTGIKY